MNSPSIVVYYNKKTNGAHSRQIFTGFAELANLGAIDVRFVEQDWNPHFETQNLVKATLNSDTDLLFDTNDGCYWIHETLEKNLEYFIEHILPKFHFVFKRSWNHEILQRLGPESSKIRPLGLNYDVTSRSNPMDRVYYGWRDHIFKRVKRSSLLCSVLGRTPDSLFYVEKFEHAPIPDRADEAPQVMLLTRLWDPIEVSVGREDDFRVREAVSHERERINRRRIECLEACRASFSGHFVGGLAASAYAEKVAPHLLVPAAITRKANFMALVKRSPICIATGGLHLSTGWRFGEYVAASRAIVSEKIFDTLPGSFAAPRNYLEFSSTEELLGAVRMLTNNRFALREMMWNNYSYYRAYGRPDAVVLNALLQSLP